MDAQQEADRKRAVINAMLVPARWKGMLGVFDLDKPPLVAFPPEAFRVGAYGLIADTSVKEDLKIIFTALGGDPLRKPYQMALAQADQLHQADLSHSTAITAAIDDVVAGGDMKFNMREVLGNYALLSQLGKNWVKSSPATLKLHKYWADGSARTHGVKLASIGLNGDDPELMTKLKAGATERNTSVQSLERLLTVGALGVSADNAAAVAKIPGAAPPAQDGPKQDGAAPAATPAAGATPVAATAANAKTPPAAPPVAPDPNQPAADALSKKIRDALDKAKVVKGEQKIGDGKFDFEILLHELQQAPEPVRDLVYKDTALITALVQRGDPKQAQRIVASLDTVESLYTSCLTTQASYDGGTTAPATADTIAPDAKDKVFKFLAARPSPAQAEVRNRVLQHAGLKLFVIDRMTDADRVKIYRLIATGEDKESLAEQIRSAAEKGQGATAARLLMKLANENPRGIDALKEDHIFRQSIEKLDQEVVVDGFPVIPLHLALTMWGLKPMSTVDPGGGARQTEIDPDGTHTPLTIDQRCDLEDQVLTPAATSLRHLLGKFWVSDSDMCDALRDFEGKSAKKPWVDYYRRLGKAPGPMLMERYAVLYPEKNLRGEVQKHVGGHEQIECERILGIRLDGATVGVLNGVVAVQGDAPPENGQADPNAPTKKKVTDLAQALRETTFGGKPLSQVTAEAAEKICDWMPEINMGYMAYNPIWPGCSAEELIALWDNYHMTMQANAPKVSLLCGIPKEQIFPIELLSNAVMEKGGDLKHKIARFFGPGVVADDHSRPILAHMGLDFAGIQLRSQAGTNALMKTDPKAALEQQSKDQYAESARALFGMIEGIRAPLNMSGMVPVGATLKIWKDKKLENAPVIEGANPTASLEERPPKSFKGYYRLEYGIDPEQQIARVLRSHFEHGENNGMNVAQAATLCGIDPSLVNAVVAPPAASLDVLDITEANQHLVRPGFTKEVAKDTAQRMWNVIHDGGQINLLMNQLYAPNTTEEQRLIRMAFRALSGGLDMQFYLQQRKLELEGKPVEEIGQKGTSLDANADKNTSLTLKGDLNKIDTAIGVAQTGTIDNVAQLRAVIGTGKTGQMDQVFKLVDDASSGERAKIIADSDLMDRIHKFCDTYAWNRVYKTLTGQSDLTDRLYSRAHGAYDSWNPFDCTDEEGMKEDVKQYVKRLKKQYEKEVREQPDSKGQKSEDLEKIVKHKVELACQKLMANPDVRDIIQDELSGDDLAAVEGLILHGGEMHSEDDVTRDGASFDTIMATLRDMKPDERVKLLANPGYMERLGERIHDPDHYRQIIVILQAGSNDDHLSKLDEAIKKANDKDIMRNLVELDEAQLAQVRGDPMRQAGILAPLDADSRALARRILKVQDKLPEPVGADDPKVEKARLDGLVENATQKILYVEVVKLGWDTLLAKSIEVFQLAFEKEASAKAPKEGDPPADPEAQKAELAKEQKANDAAAAGARVQVWQAVKDSVDAAARRIDSDKTRTTKSNVNAAKINNIVRNAVLKQRDPSSERISEQMGDLFKIKMVDGGEVEARQKTDMEGIKATIRAASPEVLVNEWSSVTKPSVSGGPSLKETYDDYLAQKEATAAAEKTAGANPDPEKVRARDEALLAKKLAFMNYAIEESPWFEQKMLSDENMGDAEDRVATTNGGVKDLGTRDNKKYNEILDVLRERLPALTKSPNSLLVAKAIKLKDDDESLLDNTNRDVLTANVNRNEKVLRQRGSQAGSGWAADPEAQRLDNSLTQYNHDTAQAQVETGTEKDENGFDVLDEKGKPKQLERGMISGESKAKLDDEGKDVDAALKAFKDKKAKVAQWLSTIIGVLVTVLLTIATGGLAGGPLVALFWTTAIAGMSATAKAAANKLVLENDYSFKDEGLKMIGTEMLTAFITGGTTILAQKVIGAAGSVGGSLLGQTRAVGAVLRTPPPLWAKYLGEFGEAGLQDAMSGTLDAGLTAIDPVYWMHGVEEGRDRAYPAAMAQLSDVPAHAFHAGLQAFLVNRVMSVGSKKQQLSDSMGPLTPGKKVNFAANAKKVFGGNGQRIVNSIAEFALKDRGPDAGHINWEDAPADLVQSYLNQVNQAAWEMHSETGNEHSHEAKVKADVTANEHLFANKHEHEDFEKMQKDNAKGPYVSVADYVGVRRGLVLDAVAAHKGDLTDVQMTTYIAWVRDAQDAAEFQRRLKIAPDSPEVRGVTAKPDARPDATAGDDHAKPTEHDKPGDKPADGAAKTAADHVKPVKAGANPEPEVAAQHLATVPFETGMDLMRRLTAGDATALDDMLGPNHDHSVDGVVWGLGKLPNGTYVVVKGTKTGVDFSQIPDCIGVAHSTPPTSEGKVPKLAAAEKGGIPIADLMHAKAGSPDLAMLLPSSEDLASGEQRVVMTRFVSLGDGHIGNPPDPTDANASPADKRIEIEVKHGKEIGRSVLDKTAAAYEATITIRSTDGTVLWQGKMYTTKIKGHGDIPSLDPKGIEIGMMPEMAPVPVAPVPEAKPEKQHADKAHEKPVHEQAGKDPAANDNATAKPDLTKVGGKDPVSVEQAKEAELQRKLTPDEKSKLDRLVKQYGNDDGARLFDLWQSPKQSKMPTLDDQIKLGHAGIELHSHFMGNVPPEAFKDQLGASGAPMVADQVSDWEPMLAEIVKLKEPLGHKYERAGRDPNDLAMDPETNLPKIKQRGASGDAIRQAEQASADIAELKKQLAQEGLGEKQKADLRAQIDARAKSAVEKSLRASDESDFNSSYEVRDELVKKFYGAGDRTAMLAKAGLPPESSIIESAEVYRAYYEGRPDVQKRIDGAVDAQRKIDGIIETAKREGRELNDNDKKQIGDLGKKANAIKEQMAYDAYAKDTLRRLAEDNIRYTEQSNSTKKLAERFDPEQLEWLKKQLVADLLAEGNKELAQRVRDLAVVNVAMVNTALFGTADPNVDNTDTNRRERTGTKDFGKQVADVVAMTARPDVVAVDIAGAEHFEFDAVGRARFEFLCDKLLQAAMQRGEPLNIRPHVGEGATDVASGKHYSDKTDRQVKDGQLTADLRAKRNLDSLIEAVENLKARHPEFDKWLTVRFGHATHTTPEQAARMAKLGIIAEVNLESNAMTGATSPTNHDLSNGDHKRGTDFEPTNHEADPTKRDPKLAGHALPELIFNDVQIILSTDAHEVMSTDLNNEYVRAGEIVDEVLAGTRAVQLTAAQASALGIHVPEGQATIAVKVGDLRGEHQQAFRAKFEGAKKKFFEDANKYYNTQRPKRGNDKTGGGGEGPTKVGATNGEVGGDGDKTHREAVNTEAVTHRANAAVEGLDPTQRGAWTEMTKKAENHGQVVLMERALAAGHSLEEINILRLAMTNMSADEVMREFSGFGIVQLYQYSCEPSAYQIAIAEVDPVFALQLRNRPELVMSQQGDALRKAGAAPVSRMDSPKNRPQAVKDGLADPAVRAQIDDLTAFKAPEGAKVGGIEPAQMHGQELHTQLEQATGTKYDVLTNNEIEFNNKGQGGFTKSSIPHDRIKAALDHQQPVIVAMVMGGGHARTIVGYSGTNYIISDPYTGKTISEPMAYFDIYTVQSLTLPSGGATHAHESSESTASTTHVDPSAPTTTGGIENDKSTTEPAGDKQAKEAPKDGWDKSKDQKHAMDAAEKGTATPADRALLSAEIKRQVPGVELMAAVEKGTAKSVVSVVFPGGGDFGIKTMNDNVLGERLNDGLIADRNELVAKAFGAGLTVLDQTYKNATISSDAPAAVTGERIAKALEIIDAAMPEIIRRHLDGAEHFYQDQLITKEPPPGEEPSPDYLAAKKHLEAIGKLRGKMDADVVAQKPFKTPVEIGAADIKGKDYRDLVEAEMNANKGALMARDVAPGAQGETRVKAYSTQDFVQFVHQTVDIRNRLIDEGAELSFNGQLRPVFVDGKLDRQILWAVRKHKLDAPVGKQIEILARVDQYFQRVNAFDHMAPFTGEEIGTEQAELNKKARDLVAQLDKPGADTVGISADIKTLLAGNVAQKGAASEAQFFNKAADKGQRVIINADIKDMGLDLWQGHEGSMNEVDKSVGKSTSPDAAHEHVRGTSEKAADGIVEFKRKVTQDFEVFYGKLLATVTQESAHDPALVDELKQEPKPLLLLGGDEIWVSLPPAFAKHGSEIAAWLAEHAHARVAITNGAGVEGHKQAMSDANSGLKLLKKFEEVRRATDNLANDPKTNHGKKALAQLLVKDIDSLYTEQGADGTTKLASTDKAVNVEKIVSEAKLVLGDDVAGKLLPDPSKDADKKPADAN